MKNPFNGKQMDAAEMLAWVQEHRQTLSSAGIVLVIVAAFLVYFFINYAAAGRQAMKNLSIAQGYAAAGAGNEALKMFDEVISRGRPRGAVFLAELSKGNLLFAMRNYRDAKDIYERLLAGRKDPLYTPFVYISLGNTLEALGEYASAATILGEMTDAYPEHFLAPRAYESLARCCELGGMPDQARQAYEKLATLYPNTFWAASAQKRLSALAGAKGK